MIMYWMQKQKFHFFGREYTIIKRNGLKIGLLGITTQYIPHWEPKENVKGLKFASAYEKKLSIMPKYYALRLIF